MISYRSPFSIITSLLAVSATASDVFRPNKVSFAALLKDDGGFDSIAFKDAMTRVGMISVTGLFASDNDSYQNKKDTLAYLHECAVDATFAEIHTFQDGTVRRTLPTRSIHNGIQPFPKTDKGESKACEKFFKSSFEFRSKVAEATAAFANRLLTVLEDQRSYPLLKSEQGYSFDTVADVVENGEHLEHFHSYQKQISTKNKEDTTIEWHIDQGLFIAFTPGRKVTWNNPEDAATITGGFAILQEDGTEAQVQFDEDDDLIFMLGDGVNQYVNSKKDDAVKLRSVPHTLSMLDHESDEARVWYGRMVLPPSDAVHPDHHITFGELRNRVIQGVGHEGSDDAALSLGCSGTSMVRNLDEETMTCGNNTIMCWHRCMDTSEFLNNVCESRGMVMNCTNPRGQLWDQNHGDFFPGCVMPNAEVATPFPNLTNYPRADSCNQSDFDGFAGVNDYNFSYDLPVGTRSAAAGGKLLWNIVDDKIQGTIAYNGLFGWIGFGFAGIGGAKNGMHGGEVIMAFPGGNYSPVTGLDMDMDFMINEYTISEDKDQSSFRHWMIPTVTTRDLSGTMSVNSTSCFTKMSFEIAGIGSKTFNLSGTDDLIWAANGVDYFAGYHLSDRARFIINWSNGTGTEVILTPPPAPVAAPVQAPTATASSAIIAGTGTKFLLALTLILASFI